MINEALALPEAEEFAARLTRLQTMWESGARMQGTMEYGQLKQVIHESLPMMKLIASECDPDFADRFEGGLNGGWGIQVALTAATELVGFLKTAEKRKAIFSPSGPKLAMASMHPWIFGAAAPLWDDGHHREAVSRAAGDLFDIYLPNKVQEPKGTDGSAMIRKAFKLPTPYLKLPGFEVQGQDRTNVYEGSQYLGLACLKLARNLSTHNAIDPGEEPVLLEELALLSRFARILSTATVM